ncbi:hypothetical protein [Bacillus sp. AK25]|uniref:hypothetical protein n=1 Tax=Bacillus sp. AK25 TaxID=3373260 RepID=UPI003AA889AD
MQNHFCNAIFAQNFNYISMEIGNIKVSENTAKWIKAQVCSKELFNIVADNLGNEKAVAEFDRIFRPVSEYLSEKTQTSIEDHIFFDDSFKGEI